MGILPKITTEDSVKLDSKIRKYKAFKNLTHHPKRWNEKQSNRAAYKEYPLPLLVQQVKN